MGEACGDEPGEVALAAPQGRDDGVSEASPPLSFVPPHDHSALFWEEVRRLPARQAEVVALKYLEGLEVAEIGSVLGVAEGTVKALLHQGRERLRRQLIAKGLVDGEV